MRPIDWAKQLQVDGVIPPQAIEQVALAIDRAVAWERELIQGLLEGVCLMPNDSEWAEGWKDCKKRMLESLAAEFSVRPMRATKEGETHGSHS